MVTAAIYDRGVAARPTHVSYGMGAIGSWAFGLGLCVHLAGHSLCLIFSLDSWSPHLHL